jgi:CheY-like chemotaxis protein
MRKRRAIVFDDEPVVLLVLKDFFETRGYEVLAFRDPIICPVYGDSVGCTNKAPCGDIILTDYGMPTMTGIELFQAQARNGCKLTSKNKALLTGYVDDGKKKDIRNLGIAFFEKPVLFDELARWVDECELRMDLSLPLGVKRKEVRECCSREISFTVPSSGSELFRGIAINMSPSGLCLRASGPLMKEDTVFLQTALPLLSPVAMVRWVERTGQDDYLAGLQCSPAR